MSILVIQGPHSALPWSGPGTEEPLLLPTAAAHAAGKSLVVRTCAGIREMIECLRQARQPDTEMVLLDSGDLDPADCVREGADLCRALDELQSPYIEVHDDSGQVLDLQVHPRNAPMVTVVVNDDRASGYSLALAIALRHLGRSANAPGTSVHL
ncbi:hypothetical protein [Pseudoxanthomonas sacheonensis]|uniref:hypothetical protein n=1 Tax=Pseudoxanthomonas sacheonensis TaxID=443615 RepID=UPI0013D18552|nr:hypothetical protein [Pseudoxanthomonas sacheonensis]KAF1706911.1 hypothetical protein CSC73_13915 [Pseudoxanthomonas sacheonensis]